MMTRMQLLLQVNDHFPEVYCRSELSLSCEQSRLCLETMFSVIDKHAIDNYALDAAERVVQATKERLEELVQIGKMSAKRDAQAVAVYQEITSAPDSAESFADFALGVIYSGPRDW